MAGPLLLIGLVLGTVPSDPQSLADAEILERAETSYREGLQARARPDQSRVWFVKAAEHYEMLQRRGYRSAVLFRNQGNAYVLAGDLPRAILAYRRGLRFQPGNGTLQSHLHYARNQTVYPFPGTFGKPGDDSWPSWLPRPSPTCLFHVSIAFHVLAWLNLTGWLIVRQTWLLILSIIAFLLTGLVLSGYFVAWRNYENDLMHPFVVITHDGVFLRKGNGFSFPLRQNIPLNRGVEARRLFVRGNWLQIELATGEIGWLPKNNVLQDDPETWK